MDTLMTTGITMRLEEDAMVYSHPDATGHDLRVVQERDPMTRWAVGYWAGECSCERDNGPDSVVFHDNDIVDVVRYWGEHLADVDLRDNK